MVLTNLGNGELVAVEGGGGGLNVKGAIDVTQPAPAADGDFYINSVSGNAHSSFGTTEFVNVNALVIYTESGWVISNTQLGSFVDPQLIKQSVVLKHSLSNCRFSNKL